jgi:hypothetical protein
MFSILRFRYLKNSRNNTYRNNSKSLKTLVWFIHDFIARFGLKKLFSLNVWINQYLVVKMKKRNKNQKEGSCFMAAPDFIQNDKIKINNHNFSFSNRGEAKVFLTNKQNFFFYNPNRFTKFSLIDGNQEKVFILLFFYWKIANFVLGMLSRIHHLYFCRLTTLIVAC